MRERMDVRARDSFMRRSPACARCLQSKATDVHHSRGKLGSLMNDERYWIPLCRTCHRWAHDNIAMARKIKISVYTQTHGTMRIPLICEKGGWDSLPR